MKLHDLREPAGTKHRHKRRGRGIAAGQGKTGGFGTKGTGARSGHGGGKRYFEGGQLPLVRRLAVKRGFRNVNRVEYAVVNVEALNRFDAGSVVDVEALTASGLVKDSRRPIKILGEGKLDRPLTVKAHAFSASAQAKIEQAGGAVEWIG
ncbi:MAG: 50S ribosomal protein L15 [Chloroflexi bacterium]|nr:50S ribosomal protein L15 [Chloroflexota bacterium]